MAKQRFRKAIEKFVRAIELGGDDLSLVCVAELNIGSCYAMLNNHEKALEHTEKCLEILLGLLGLPLEVPEGREEGSFYRTLFSRSIGVMAYYNKGIIFKAMGRLDEARVIFDKLIKYLHPQFISQEPIFRNERFEIIAEMVERKRDDVIHGIIPVEYVKELYRRLGYSEDDIEKDYACARLLAL